MRLFIEPNEPLMFRTGRPFDAGQNNFAESLFPPSPETLQGAVRATIASYWHPQKNIAEAFNDPDLTNLIGDRKSYGRFRLTGLTLGRYYKAHEDAIERLLPPPAHIVTRGTEVVRLLPHDLSLTNIASNFPTGITHYLAPEQETSDASEKETSNELKPLEGWLTETDLYTTLGRKDVSGIKTIKRDEIYQEESRLGIGIQHGTKSTEEGYLYQMLMIRMNHKLKSDYTYGFVVDIALAPLAANAAPLSDEQVQKELHLFEPGWMTLGGEQRAAHFRVVPTVQPQAPALSRDRRLLYLATPAAFDTGWKPSPKFAPLDAPNTAALHRYEAIGGWKLNPGDAQGENKVMRRCVAAGSVYFFDRRISSNTPLTDYGQEIGYGITYEGEW